MSVILPATPSYIVARVPLWSPNSHWTSMLMAVRSLDLAESISGSRGPDVALSMLQVGGGLLSILLVLVCVVPHPPEAPLDPDLLVAYSVAQASYGTYAVPGCNMLGPRMLFPPSSAARCCCLPLWLLLQFCLILFRWPGSPWPRWIPLSPVLPCHLFHL